MPYALRVDSFRHTRKRINRLKNVGQKHGVSAAIETLDAFRYPRRQTSFVRTVVTAAVPQKALRSTLYALCPMPYALCHQIKSG